MALMKPLVFVTEVREPIIKVVIDRTVVTPGKVKYETQSLEESFVWYFAGGRPLPHFYLGWQKNVIKCPPTVHGSQNIS